MSFTRRKLALAIGNNDYSRAESKLRHCVNDAEDLSKTLTDIGFHQVHKHINLTNVQMIDAIRDFSEIISDGDLVLFYFSGHGYQVSSSNYLMPIDDDRIHIEDDVPDFAVPVERTLDRLARKNPSHVTIFILDCCRKYWPKNVLKTKGSAEGKGLNYVDAPAGTFIQFACGANRTASDGVESDRNGLFTKHLLKHIVAPGEDIVQIFQGVAGDVYMESKGEQKPLSVNGLIKKGLVRIYEPDDVKPKAMDTSNKDTDRTPKNLLTTRSLGTSFEGYSLDDRSMILLGRLTSREHYNKLTEQVREMESDGWMNFTSTSIEKLEYLLEYVTWESSTVTQEREDHFHTALVDLLGRDTSLETLRTACRRCETSTRGNVEQIMKGYEDQAQALSSYFTGKGLAADNARAAAFALLFYTRTKSNIVNRTTRRVARYSNREPLEKADEDQMKETAPIIFHLYRALSFIPYYWGPVSCAYQLSNEELSLCHPGALISWMQFVRSRKLADLPQRTTGSSHDTHFRIYSWTGRSIKAFSAYPDEGEVIFLPHSTYFVYKHELSMDGKQHLISMWQVELGLSKHSVLWVDDKIFQSQSEIKAYMENAAEDGLNLDVRFIPRSSTDAALAFLRSPFGQRLKNQSTFRLITCMNRKSEESAYNAGIRLIKAVRALGFENHCLIFTSDQKRGEAIVQSQLSASEQKCLLVADQISGLKTFISF